MATTAETHLDTGTRYGLIALAIAQGYALYFLHLAIEDEFWPVTELPWLKALYAVAIGLPVFFYLGVERIKDRRNLVAGVGLAVLLFGLGWHLGWVEEGASTSSRHRHPFTPAFVVSVSVAFFILAMLFRTWATDDSRGFSYERMLYLSWQQALTIAQLGLFVGAFWLLLLLWGGLFSAIGIGFFKALFDSIAFIYPVTWLVMGLGLVLIRERIRFIATVQHMCEALIKALLPLVAGIILLFLAALPITGVQPVWDTGSAATLLMLLTLVLLFAFNAVLVSGEHNYRPSLRYFILVAVAALPVSSLLAAWALWLRIDQYGLTLDRLWAAVILLLISGFSFSYTISIIWRRDGAFALIRAANRWLAIFVIGVLLLVNSPLADLRKWTAESQADRLLDGRSDHSEFDYAHLRFDLGTYGIRALERIENSELARTHPEVARRVSAVRKQEQRWSLEPEVDLTDMKAVASMLHSAHPLPEELLAEIARLQKECMKSDAQCMAMRPDLASGQVREIDWLVFRTGRYVTGSAYSLVDGRWQQVGTVSTTCNGRTERPEQLIRLDGPFLAYRSNDCYYTVTPTIAALEKLAGLKKRAEPVSRQP
ncbi:DUF4153 domain-containing protein [Pseudomonas sp. gcc21]|uniref:DUF4153 domain-containing protein n=1 Tax=Pseudomonas sp. gcc21 TaxID=2726989 RepID=UPI0014513B86|nr:DUF4153 domain-containing protein [Pseudomonas sp. gcc21]QJD58035.1 DUF4153 domain-containing protein [Pseudomonas sp. gcc21]